MRDPEFVSNIRREYVQLDEMIAESSKMLETLVQMQGPAYELQYTRWKMFLCLIKNYDAAGRCCGVRWAKYHFSPKNGKRSWYNGRLPGKIPPSTLRLMSPAEQERFREIDAVAVQLSKLRHSLTSKKKRIFSTFQNIRQTDKPRLQEVTQKFQALHGAKTKIEEMEYF